MNINQLKQHLFDASMSSWADCIEAQIKHRLIDKPHGDLPRWQAVVDALPEIPFSTRTLNQGLIQVGSKSDTTPEQRQALQQTLKQLIPWRKGPYQLHGVMIDTEWRSDWKCDRLEAHIEPLQDRVVLDVGCGNGYHCWRMAGSGAKQVFGVDPMAFFHLQFQSVQKLLTGGDASDPLKQQVWHLPLGVEDIPEKLQAFDTVFSMGVLYHRRSPLDHLMTLRDALKPSGQLVLETLVINGKSDQVLIPEGRYGKMRNVWFIPSVGMLEHWLKRCGFIDIRTVDVSQTTTQEQRATDWMQFESLADFLDPKNPALTVEGYPAPRRAITLAMKPA